MTKCKTGQHLKKAFERKKREAAKLINRETSRAADVGSSESEKKSLEEKKAEIEDEKVKKEEIEELISYEKERVEAMPPEARRFYLSEIRAWAAIKK